MPVKQHMAALTQAVTSTDSEIARLKQENDMLRSLLPALGAPCVYCGAVDIAKCPSGFPGCAQADDILCGDDVTMKWLLDDKVRLKARIKKLEALCAEASRYVVNIAVIEKLEAASRGEDWETPCKP